MKAFHKDGRLGFIVRLTLPRSDGDDVFTSFYTKLSDKYMEAAERRIKEINVGVRPLILSVTYELAVDETPGRGGNHAVIKRHVCLNDNGILSRLEYLDFYDFERNIFTK